MDTFNFKYTEIELPPDIDAPLENDLDPGENRTNETYNIYMCVCVKIHSK